MLESREDGAKHLAGQRAAVRGSCASSVAKISGAATNPSTASPPVHSATTTSDATRRSAIRSIADRSDILRRAACLNHHSPFSRISPPNFESIRCARRPKPDPDIRRRACRRRRSSRRCSSPRCDSIRSDPQHPEADRFVLSKGHAAPILYAAWAAAGAFPRERSAEAARCCRSDLEGHPTPRLPFVDVATGSLGQGLCAGVGIALNARRIGSDYRTYVLMGDGETAEGSVWEAAQVAEHHKLDNLCGIIDVNGYGQSRATQWERDFEEHASRWRAFGWHAVSIDGHDMKQVLAALAEARTTTGKPTMIVARTLKGKGCSIFEGKDNWHGKALKKGAEADAAIAELEAQYVKTSDPAPVIPKPKRRQTEGAAAGFFSGAADAGLQAGESVATREAYGTALAALGAIDRRVVALDADVKNSTFSERFEKVHPDRFYQMFIAEQAMVGAAMGLAARGAIPFPSTLRRVSRARVRLHPHGRHLERQRQARRLARRRVDWRGRPVADGARGSGDVPRRAELHGVLSVATR